SARSVPPGWYAPTEIALRDAAVVVIVVPVSRSEFQVGYGSSFESAIHAWTVAAVPAVSFNVSFQVPEEIDGLSPGFGPAGGRMETKITPRSVAVGVLEVTPTGLRSSVSLAVPPGATTVPAEPFCDVTCTVSRAAPGG